MPKQTIEDTFFLSFVGQHVLITINMTQTASEATATHQVMETNPIVYEGVLLDYDNDYYYLASKEKDNEITQAIRKSTVIHVMTVEEKDLYTEILEHFPAPEKKEDIN